MIDQAVVLHARFWDTAELWALDWLPPINTPLFLAAADLAAEKLPRYLEYWEGKVPGRRAWPSSATSRPHYPALLDWWVDQGHPTFAHMDFRADNFLFGGSAGTDVVTVLDWQLSVRGVGVWDVANFLAGSLTVDDRRAWEDDLVRRYHAGLLAAGVTGYDWDRCWRDYRYAIGQQAWSTCPMGDLDPGNDRGQLLLDTITPAVPRRGRRPRRHGDARPLLGARGEALGHQVVEVAPDEAAQIRAAAQCMAAVDPEALTGDPRRVGAGEEGDGAGDVVDGAEATERHLGQVVGAGHFVRGERVRRVGGDEAGLHGVDADPVRAELVGRVAHQHVEPGLARAVRPHERVGERPGDGGHGDDRSPAAAASAGAPCLIVMNVPITFRRRSRSNASTSTRARGPSASVAPALATITSSAPVASRAKETALATSASSVTSATTKRHP